MQKNPELDHPSRYFFFLLFNTTLQFTNIIHNYDRFLLFPERLGSRPCPLCLKIISNKSNLLKHIRIRHNTDYYDQAKCPKCYKNFKNKYSLRAHINIYHKENNVQPLSSEQGVKEDHYSYNSIMEPPPMLAQPSTMPEQYFGIMSTTNLAPEQISMNSPMFLTQSLTSPAMSSTS